MPGLDPSIQGPTARAEEKLTLGFKPYNIHRSLSSLRLSSRPSDRREREPGTMVRPGAEPLHGPRIALAPARLRSEEHTSELQSLIRISYAVFCLKKKNQTHKRHDHTPKTNN